MVESEGEEVQSACHQLQGSNCAKLGFVLNQGILPGEKCGLELDWEHSCCVWRKGESEGSIRFHHDRLAIQEPNQSFEIEACELCTSLCYEICRSM